MQTTEEVLQSGWPNKYQVPETLKPYYSMSAELTIQQGILQIMVPSSLHPDMPSRLHTGHQGITYVEEHYSLCGGLALASNWKNWLQTVLNAEEIEFKP